MPIQIRYGLEYRNLDVYLDFVSKMECHIFCNTDPDTDMGSYTEADSDPGLKPDVNNTDSDFDTRPDTDPHLAKKVIEKQKKK